MVSSISSRCRLHRATPPRPLSHRRRASFCCGKKGSFPHTHSDVQGSVRLCNIVHFIPGRRPSHYRHSWASAWPAPSPSSPVWSSSSPLERGSLSVLCEGVGVFHFLFCLFFLFFSYFPESVFKSTRRLLLLLLPYLSFLKWGQPGQCWAHPP
jgi:hypothetical protein